MVMKVKNGTHPKQLGLAIFHAIRENGEVYLNSIGGGALNTCVKGLIVANELFEKEKQNIRMTPSFIRVKTDDEKEIVAIQWHVELEK